MSLLDHPAAQALLNDATVSAEDVRGCRGRLTRFLARYLPLFYRQEQRDHATIFVRGLLSDLERKSAEPIARQADVPSKNIQYFVVSTSSVAASGTTTRSWPRFGVTSSRKSPILRTS